ncbi:DedA family protein [Desulfovibrio sp. OttesenSCG-928-F07]|nr:DedA family protein [Desulfovibrio sp. OttesenSCG-928-F07]
MTFDSYLAFMNEHGMIFLCLVVFLEYLNMPGLPAGLVFPAAGVWVASAGESFILALLLSVIAGMLASMVLYIAGRIGGPPLLNKFRKRSASMRLTIDRYVGKMRTHANKTAFIARFIPVLRTFIGLPAGAIGMDIKSYVIFSSLGILGWNATLMLAGYFFGDLIFSA